MVALLTFGLVVAAVMGLTLLNTAQYRATSRLLLDDQGGSGADVGGLGSIFNDSAGQAVETQIQLLSSPLILDEVYKETNIKPGAVDLTVQRVEKTNVIELVGVGSSKGDVEHFIAAMPKVYQQNRREDRLREVSAQLDFAKKDLSAENDKLLKTEQAIRDFNIAHGVTDPTSEAGAALQNVASTRSQLASARATVSSAQAQIAALQSALEALPRTVDSPTISTNPQLETLQIRLAELENTRKNLAFLYKPNDDQMVQNQAQIDVLKRRIANTPPTVTNNSISNNPAVTSAQSKIADARADLKAQQATVSVLEKQLAAQEAQLPKFSTIQQQGASLVRQLAANQDAVKTGLANVRALQVRYNALAAVGAPVTIIKPGGSAKNISPPASKNLTLALFLGVLLGCGAALLRDSLDDRIRDENEARHLAGAPVLGYFPLSAVTDERQILDLNSPNRVLLETFRALRSNVQFALMGSKGHKLQITSTVPNEGKSYIASNLAITMALDGRRVILVDADLHRPTMHERFEGKRQPGLTNILVGQVALEDALQDVGIANLRLLSAGALPPNPAELLNSPAMGVLMGQLEAQADLVIFDSPPLLATSDSQLLSARMDGVVFVMQMGAVARSGTLRAFELLKQAHANVVGVVFNKVEANQNGNTYDSYSGYYALESNASDADALAVNGHSNGAAPLKLQEKNAPTAPHSNGSAARATPRIVEIGARS